MTGLWAMARLTRKRLLRGRIVWVVAILAALPLVLAAVLTVELRSPSERWWNTAEMMLRSLVMLAPVLLLAGAVSDENDAKTYTYLWSRPIRRQVVILGKMVAIVPIIAGLAVLALAAGCAITAPDQAAAVLARTAGAAIGGVIAVSAFAVGLGALFPRYPTAVALGWVVFAEQALPTVKAVQNLSALYHVQVIAGLPRSFIPSDAEPIESALALVMLTALWLGVAWWRMTRLELGAADG